MRTYYAIYVYFFTYDITWYAYYGWVWTAIESDLTTDFKQAGYADIETNASYVGGFVRQVGNLSFSRVFQAGHEGKPYIPNSRS